MTTRRPLTLPNEIWMRVLENLTKEQDLADAWMTCRHVSHFFKDVVERLFRDRHLSKTWILFRLGSMYNEDGQRVFLNGDFDFNRFSEDKNVAIFKMNPGLERYHKILRRRLKTALADTPIDAPVHTVQIRRSVNDTPIPGLSIDYEKWEMTLDWRQLYTSFFGEQQIRDRLMGKWVQDKEEWTLDIKRQLDGGEIDTMTAIEEAMTEFGGGHEEAQRMARRARIRRQYKQEEGYEYDFEQDGDSSQEKAILQKLRERESFTVFEEYSDDEEEEEEWEDEDHDDDHQSID